jgi:hypothetical protein
MSEQTLIEMRRASALVDDADGPQEYQTRLIALALIARQFVREAALSASGAGVGWQPIATAPIDREVWFWVVPKTADETYIDTSGEPILSWATPHLFRGRRGTWGSLLKATHWQDIHDPDPPLAGVDASKDSEDSKERPTTKSKGRA